MGVIFLTNEDKVELKQEILNIPGVEDVNDIKEDYYSTSYPKAISYTIIEGSYAYVPDTGTQGNITSWARGNHTEPISVNSGEQFLYTGRISNVAPAAVFYNSNEPSSSTYISATIHTGISGATYLTDYHITVPEGATHIVFNALDYSSIGLSVKEILTVPKFDEINYFNKRYADKIKQLSFANPFAWKSKTKGVLSIRIDGFYEDIDYFAKAAIDRQLPIMFAGEPSKVNFPVSGLAEEDKIGMSRLDVLTYAVSNGGEILLRPGKTITDANYETIQDYFIKPTMEFENLGFNVKGTSVASIKPTASVASELDTYINLLFDYSDGYGTKDPYVITNSIVVPSNYADLDAIKSFIDDVIQSKLHRTITFHKIGDSYSSTLITKELLNGILDYIKTKRDSGELDVMTWGEVYNTYKTTNFEKRLAALEAN